MPRRNYWKVAHGSVTGTGHLQAGQGCQDYTCFLTMPRLTPDTIIAAAADGLGSAAQSALGSRIASQAACAHASHLLWQQRNHHADPDALESVLNHAILNARTSLEKAARTKGIPLPQLATTITLVIHTSNTLAAIQIGDGAAVVSTSHDDFHALLKPDRGEYANETAALTQRRSLQQAKLAIAKPHQPVTTIALTTDGLVHVTMDAATSEPHNPFYQKMSSWLRQHEGPHHPNTHLAEILASSFISNRTKDDVSLFLAVREPRKC